MNRREFFKKIGVLSAAVILCPEVAFRAPAASSLSLGQWAVDLIGKSDDLGGYLVPLQFQEELMKVMKSGEMISFESKVEVKI